MTQNNLMVRLHSSSFRKCEISHHFHHSHVHPDPDGPGDLGSIPGRVIPKTQKMVLDASLLNTQHYKVRIKGKVEPSREGVAPSPTSWCSSYRKGSLRVTLDYGRQLYLLYLGSNNWSNRTFQSFIKDYDKSLETIQLRARKWLILNRIIRVW